MHTKQVTTDFTASGKIGRLAGMVPFHNAGIQCDRERSERMPATVVTARDYDPPLDPGIAPYVQALQSGHVETFESCEGGVGHAFPQPTIRFHGLREEGLRALAVAQQAGLQVTALRRVWDVIDGEPTGPHWEMVFARAARPESSD